MLCRNLNIDLTPVIEQYLKTLKATAFWLYLHFSVW